MRPCELLCESISADGQWIKRTIGIDGLQSCSSVLTFLLLPAHTRKVEDKLGLAEEREALYDYLLLLH